MSVCGKCGKPIKTGDGIRHYGTFVAHMEYQCLHLLRDELAAAKARIIELESDAERVRAAAEIGRGQ